MKRVIINIVIALFSVPSFASQTVQESTKEQITIDAKLNAEINQILDQLESAVAELQKDPSSSNMHLRAQECIKESEKLCTNIGVNTEINKRFRNIMALYHIQSYINLPDRFHEFSQREEIIALKYVANQLSLCPFTDNTYKNARAEMIHILAQEIKRRNDASNDEKLSQTSENDRDNDNDEKFSLLECEPFLNVMKEKTKKRLNKSFDFIDFTETFAIPETQVTYAHWAAHDGLGDLLQRIIKKHPSLINKPDINGDTPLLHAISNKQAKTVKLLLDLGATVHRINEQGESAIILAVIYNSPEIVELLLTNKDSKNRANINSKSIDGYTPLMLALERNNPKLVAKLLTYNPDLALTNNNGKNVFYIAKYAFEDRNLFRHTKDQADSEIKELNDRIIAMLYNHANASTREQKYAEEQKMHKKARAARKKLKKQEKKQQQETQQAKAAEEYKEHVARITQQAEDTKKQEEKSKNQSRQHKKAQREEERLRHSWEEYEKKVAARLALMRKHRTLAKITKPFEHTHTQNKKSAMINAWKALAQHKHSKRIELANELVQKVSNREACYQKAVMTQEAQIMIDELSSNQQRTNNVNCMLAQIEKNLKNLNVKP